MSITIHKPRNLVKNRKPSMNTIIPASKEVSSKDGFVNPIQNSWLDVYEAPPSKIQLTFSSLGIGGLSGLAGATVGSIIDVIIGASTNTFVPMFTTSASILAGVGTPMLLNLKMFGAYKKWYQVKTIIGNSLQTWLLEHHNILLPDEKTLQQIVYEMRPREYSFEEKKEIYFYDADKKLYHLSKNPRGWNNQWRVTEAKTLTADGPLNLKSIPGAKPTNPEKNKNLLWWNVALNKKHETLQKNIDMLHKQPLNVEDTHTLQRVEKDLNDLLRITESITKISSPNAEDIQSLNTTFEVLEKELQQLATNEISNMRKELKVKENYITSRSHNKSKHMTLG